MVSHSCNGLGHARKASVASDAPGAWPRHEGFLRRSRKLEAGTAWPVPSGRCPVAGAQRCRPPACGLPSPSSHTRHLMAPIWPLRFPTPVTSWLFPAIRRPRQAPRGSDEQTWPKSQARKPPSWPRVPASSCFRPLSPLHLPDARGAGAGVGLPSRQGAHWEVQVRPSRAEGLWGC